jgi:hypothetical protein
MITRSLRTCSILLVAALMTTPWALAGAGSAAGLASLPTVSVSPAVSVSEDAYVPKGQVHEGDLVAVFGKVRVEGTVTGQVVVVLGSLDLSGEVQGDTVSILTTTVIHETARIGGQLVNVGGSLDQAAGSRIDGETINVNFMRFMPFTGGSGLSALLRAIFIFKLMLLALLFLFVLLATALVPRRLSVMAAEFPRRWGWALLVGLGTYAGVFVGGFILVCTIIGIPLALALLPAMWVTKIVGLASIFYLIGNTAGRNLFHRELPHLASVLGGFVVYAVLALIPFFGFPFKIAMSFLAVGIVLLTRFGSERIAPPLVAQPSPPPGPSPSQEPAGAPPASPVQGDSP